MLARIISTYLLCAAVYSLNMLEYYRTGKSNRPRGPDDDMFYVKPK